MVIGEESAIRSPAMNRARDENWPKAISAI